MKKTILFLTTLAISLFLISSTPFVSAEDCMHDPVYERNWNAEVTTGMRVRNIPCMETSIVLTTVPVGEVVKVIAETDGYYKVRLKDGTEGWSGQWLMQATNKPFNEETTVIITPLEPLYDVAGHVYETAVRYLKENGVVEGYADGSFQPNNPVNRAEFTKIIINSKYDNQEIENCLTQNNTYLFTDVSKNEWYSKYICTAKKYGIINGHPDGTFKPSDNINVAEAGKILVNTFDIATDTQGSEWYSPFIYALQDKNFIPQTVSSVNNFLNRGEMSELIWRIKLNKTDQLSKEILYPPVIFDLTEYNGWQQFTSNGYIFNYPGNWYHGIKRGWNYLSEEKDYIDNLNVPYYMNVDTYVATYMTSASTSLSDADALRTKVWFEHPEIESEYMNINGLSALKRKFRASAGSVVNGRTTHENEIIIQYTYRNGGNIYVVLFFNARGIENYGVDNFEKIARSVRKG